MQHMELSGTRPADELPNWRRSLADAIRDPDELCDLLGLDDGARQAARASAATFPLVVPRGFVARMKRGDPNDPLLRQALPTDAELAAVTDFVADPVGDRDATLAPGLLQKYEGRALLIATGVCAVHCRYCFRRNFPYAEAPRGLERWEPALRRIADDSSIAEVILSGGDPLTLTDDWLGRLVDRLASIGHVRRLRVHSRVPIVLPERVDDGLLGWLAGGRLTPILVVHANHPREIDDNVASAMRRLADAGILLFNQAVLLRGVNDDVETQVALSEKLLDCRVTPYYLHQLDRVAGAAHFETSAADGRRLVGAMRARLPGYAVPRYVRETPGAPFKEPL